MKPAPKLKQNDTRKLPSEYECQIPYIIVHLSETSRQYPFDEKKMKYCCDEFKHQLGISIYFDLHYDHDQQKTVPRIVFERVDGYDQEHDTVDYITEIPMKFCPFCGGQINVYLSKEQERYVKECKERIVKEPVYAVRDKK